MSDTGLNSDQLVIGTANNPGAWMSQSLDTAAPTTIDGAWGTGWVSLGYLSEDGPTISQSTDTEDINAWQALGVLRSIITNRTATVQMQLMEWTPENLAAYWDIDTPVPGTNGLLTFSVRSDEAGRRRQLGIDVRDGDNLVRLIFPRVQLNAAGDLQFQRSSAAMLDCTFAALETDGVLLHQLVQIGGATTRSSYSASQAVAASSGV
ncbi:MAG: hypothetical protein J2P59_02060 [Acidimicrobiales bacterium]|nr:hypothetical protein [Acidimicrobiales bacterium]